MIVRYRNVPVLVSLVVVLIAFSQSQVWAQDAVRVVGGTVNWTGEIRGLWLGGNKTTVIRLLDTLGDKIKETGGPILKKFDDPTQDVYFVYLSTSEIAEINIYRMPDTNDLTKKDVRDSMWQWFAQTVDNSNPGAKTKLERDSSGSTGGFLSYTGVFRTSYPGGKATNRAVHIVSLNPREWHLFMLDSDARSFGARLLEFQQLLQTVKYQK